jgi:hypothetical protein
MSEQVKEFRNRYHDILDKYGIKTHIVNDDVAEALCRDIDESLTVKLPLCLENEEEHLFNDLKLELVADIDALENHYKNKSEREATHAELKARYYGILDMYGVKKHEIDDKNDREAECICRVIQLQLGVLADNWDLYDWLKDEIETDLEALEKRYEEIGRAKKL